jgi:hypothetical protein
MTATFGEEMAEDTIDVRPSGKYIAPALADEPSGPSLLDELVEVVQTEVDNKIKLAVDEHVRPGGWVFEFEAVLSMAEIKKYQKRATYNNRVKPEDADHIIANGLPLCDKNIGIYKGNQQVFDEDGDPLTLTSTTWLEKVCKQTPRNYDSLAGLKLFVGDAQILKMGVALLKAAGYGAEMEPLDPTYG